MENKQVSVIAQKALLVQLIIHQWSGVKQDQKARNTVETTHKTDLRVGNYQKKLLPGSKELDLVRSIAQNIRKFVDKQTLPWYTDGTRILSSMNYIEFTQAFSKHKSKYDEAVNDFLSKYDSLKLDAQRRLGDLYSELDYPTIQDLRYSFDCVVNFMPVPDVSDFRVELSEAEKERFVNTMKQVESDARVEVYNRLKDVIGKAATKLSDPEASFRNTLISNINEMLNMVPLLNVTDDKDLDMLRTEISSFTQTIVPNACRDVKTYRENTAKQLNEIMDKMNAFMGV